MWQKNYEGFKKWIFIALVLTGGGMFYQMLWTYLKMPFRRKSELVITWIVNGAFNPKYIQYTIANIALMVGIAGITIIAFMAVSKWLRATCTDLEDSLGREEKLKVEKQAQWNDLQKEIHALGVKNQALSEDVEKLQTEIRKVREEKGLDPEVKTRLSEFSARSKGHKEFKESSPIPIIESKKEPVAEKEVSKEKSLRDDLKDIVLETMKDVKAAEKKEEKSNYVEKLPAPVIVEPVHYQPPQPPQPTTINIEQKVTNKSTCSTCFKWFIILVIIGTIANLIWWKMLLGQLFR